MYELSGASLQVEDHAILEDMSWAVPERAVSVVFGAGGAGKTSLLRALAGMPSPSVKRQGTWRHAGDVLFDTERNRAVVPGVAWSPQPPRGWRRERGRWSAGLRRALERPGPAVLLLDEPNAWVHEDDYPELVESIRARARECTVVLTTHHVAFGQECADHVCLLGGHRILAAGSADAFFGSECSYVRHFLKSGSIWTGRMASPPASFHWVLDGMLAGMAQPGLLRPIEEDLEFLAAHHVDTLVTLTENRLGVEAERLAAHGIGEVVHLPIREMGVPATGTAIALVWRVARMLDAGKVVVFHCREGLERTGLMLALVLMVQGASAPAAIDLLRAIQPTYIQTNGQISFVRAMEQYLVLPKSLEPTMNR